MKTKASKNRLFQFLGTEKGLLTMSAIVVLYALAYHYGKGTFIYPDTETYFNAYYSLTGGETDMYRTPVYPLFIGITSSIFGNTYNYIAILLLQVAIFLLSVHYFYRIACLLKSDKIAYWLTFIYGVIPIVPSWTPIILTESLAISGSVFYLYFTISAVKTGDVKKTWLSTLWLLLLVMLRPSFIYLIPVSLFMFLIGNWRESRSRKIIYNGLAGCITVTILFCGYSYRMKRSYGVFTPSAISVINKYVMDRDNGSFDINAITDTEFKTYVDSLQNAEEELNIYTEALLVINEFGCERMNDAVKESRKSIIGSLKGIDERIYTATRDRYRIASRIVPFILIEPINPNTGAFLLLLVITAGVVIAYIYKRKQLPWITLLLLLFAAGNIAVTVMGAPDDYGRLQLPSFPAELLLLGLIIQMIKDKTITDNKFEN